MFDLSFMPVASLIQQECDLLAINLINRSQSIDFEKFKPVMLAALRSLPLALRGPTGLAPFMPCFWSSFGDWTARDRPVLHVKAAETMEHRARERLGVALDDTGTQLAGVHNEGMAQPWLNSSLTRVLDLNSGVSPSERG